MDVPEDHHVSVEHIESIIVRDKSLSDRYVEIRMAGGSSIVEGVMGKIVYRIPEDVQPAEDIHAVISKAQEKTPIIPPSQPKEE